MKSLTRRQFLRLLALATTSVVVDQFMVACGYKETTTPIPATVVSEPTLPHKPRLTGPELVVARGGEPEQLVRQAMNAFGGIDQIVSQGADVIIKPNMCSGNHTYEYAATTNPWVIAELIKLCYEAGAAKVRVMDSPFSGSPEQVYQKSGIAEQVERAGGEMVIMSPFIFRETEIPKARDIQRVEVYEDVLNTDVLINVPIAKHHNRARLTLGMKNLLGVIKDRPAMHRNLGQRIADLTSLVMPTLTVVDAVRILVDHGPGGGNLDDVKKTDTVIVSRDIVAADSYAASLFGLPPEDLEYVQAGTEMGLGSSNLKELRIEEVNINA